MKNARALSTTFVLATLAWLAASAVQAAEVVEKPEDQELRPLVTRYAKTATRITVTGEFKAFREVELQEAENFDGISFNIDLVVPLSKRFQIRFNMPIYTAGEARLVVPPHEDISIWGFGGTYDFANLQGDWQFVRQADRGFNLSISGGAGAALRYLNTSVDDRYNHLGRVALGGLKWDRRFNEHFTLLANAGLRYYWESDDINPVGNGDDEFTHADLSVAAVFNPFHRTVYPVLELAYAGDFGGYDSILIIPELIWPIHTHFELKAGATIGLTSDGEQVGARVQAVVRF